MEELTHEPLMDIRRINKYYQVGENKLHVLKDISLSIQAGEFISIMGPSGSGKSTLINILGFLDNHFDGCYHFSGRSVAELTDQQISQLRNQEVGFVFQDFNLIETMTIEENVGLPLIYAGYTAKETRDPVRQMLERLGIASKSHAHPHELSGGQRQRVAIARALINRPQFIIADEPTGALDTKTSSVIMEILEELNQRDGVAIVMVTHDPSLQRFAKRHLVIVDGCLEEKGRQEAEKLADQYRAQAYQEELGGAGHANQ